jgi:hypothetical protein
MKERLPGRQLELGRVVQEGDIDAAGITGVGMRDRVGAAGEPLVHFGRQEIEDVAVLHLAHA